MEASIASSFLVLASSAFLDSASLAAFSFFFFSSAFFLSSASFFFLASTSFLAFLALSSWALDGFFFAGFGFSSIDGS
jgi:hypothetical protein